MDFLSQPVGRLYRRYLGSSLMGAVVMSIYSFVDTIAVGQSEGAQGAAAMAVIAPMYGLTAVLGILCGIGGSVLMTSSRGQGKPEKGSAYFTASLILMGALTLLSWLAFALFHEPILTFFGADSQLMPKVMEYAQWVIGFYPAFITPIYLGAFLRNDGAPGLAMTAVIVGGCVNILGDWLLVFPLGMGMRGAAIATVIGTLVQVGIMVSHFFSSRCGLRLIKPFSLKRGLGKILSVGFGASVLDLGTVVLAILMNNQIMRYAGTTELAVFGVISTLSALFQALFGGVGQAVQPLISANCGAGKKDRIRRFAKLALATALVMGVGFALVGELLPREITALFIDAQEPVLAAAPRAYHAYFPVFLFMGVTVVATYILQSTLNDRLSLLIAILRSVVVSGALLIALPAVIGIDGVWLAMPVSELAVAILALILLTKRVLRPKSA